MRRLATLCIFVLVMMLFAYIAHAGEDRNVKFLTMEGDVSVKIAEGKWTPAKADTILHEGDMIKTGSDSTAMLDLNDGRTATIDLSENSQLLITDIEMDDETKAKSTLLDLAIGKILIEAEKLHTEEEAFEVKTPTTIVGVRGTTFTVEVEALD